MNELKQAIGWTKKAIDEISYQADMASEVYKVKSEARRLRAIEDRLSKIYDLFVEIENLDNE